MPVYAIVYLYIIQCMKTINKTSLLTDVLSATSHADESSESSNIMFLNSEIKLLNSSLLLSSAGADISLICLLS